MGTGTALSPFSSFKPASPTRFLMRACLLACFISERKGYIYVNIAPSVIVFLSFVPGDDDDDDLRALLCIDRDGDMIRPS